MHRSLMDMDDQRLQREDSLDGIVNVRRAPNVYFFGYLEHPPSRLAVPSPQEVAVLLSNGTMKALTAALKRRLSAGDLAHLGLSSIIKRDLQRHLAAALTAAPPPSLLLDKAVLLALSPYQTCTDQQLWAITLRRRLLAPALLKKGLNRRKLLVVLHFLDAAPAAAQRDRVFISRRTELDRRTVTERCLRALEEAVELKRVGEARAQQEVRRLLVWARLDALAHDETTIGLLLHRVVWLQQQIGSRELARDSAASIGKYLLRHVIPFLMKRPDLVLSEHACWETLGIDSALSAVALPCDVQSASITPTTTADRQARSFFEQASTRSPLEPWLNAHDGGLLREPQRLALLALMNAFSESSTTPAVDTQNFQDSDAVLPTLMALRSWLSCYLHSSYTAQPDLFTVAAVGDAHKDDESTEDGDNDKTDDDDEDDDDGEHNYRGKRDYLGEILSALTSPADATASSCSKVSAAKLIVLPTGVGKSRVICLAAFTLPSSSPARRVLVLCPSVEIRSQIASSMKWIHTEGSPNAGSYSLAARCIRVIELSGETETFTLEQSDVCVSTIHQLQGDSLLKRYRRSFFDLVLIDEAHHAEAPSYRLVREHFNRARYVYFTGTPHRSDQKPLRAELIYSCTMRDALLRDEPYIKRLCYLPVPVTSMTITHAATEQRFQLDSFEDIVAFASRTDCSRWMAKALSSSLSSHSHVIRLIVAKLQALRAVSGVHHQAILQAADTTEAEFLVALWRALPGGNACPHIASIHSELSTKDRDRVMQDLRANRLDAIVHVGMLGEGFDHQTLSVCGIFRRFSSMAPFVQLVGRILRRIQGAGANDNVGYVIAHPGLGLAPLWRAYKKESPTILPPSDDDDADDGNADLCEKKSAHVTVLPATMKNFENMDLQETVSDIPYEDWFL